MPETSNAWTQIIFNLKLIPLRQGYRATGRLNQECFDGWIISVSSVGFGKYERTELVYYGDAALRDAAPVISRM